MARLFFTLGCLSALVAVALGAFGAHGLRGRVTPEMLNVFEIGVRYQLYHALALLAVGAIAGRLPGGSLAVAASASDTESTLRSIAYVSSPRPLAFPIVHVRAVAVVWVRA